MFHGYPYSDFHEINLDWLLAKFKSLSDEVKAEVAELLQRVTTAEEAIAVFQQYFDNLDVQEEINNKLEDMYDSGELQEIIAVYILGYTSPQIYGAKADGVTDDTNAITQAIATGMPVYFPIGNYKVTGAFDFTNTVKMEDEAIITFDGITENDTPITISGSGNDYELNIDVNNCNPDHALFITGNSNHFHRINIKNQIYNGTEATRGIYVYGNDNEFCEINAVNFYRNPMLASWDNDSMPQVFTAGGNSDHNIIKNIVIRDCVCGIVHYSKNTLIVDNIYANNMADNLLYIANGGTCTAGNIIADTVDEGIVVITDDTTGTKSNLYASDFTVTNAGNYCVRLHNSGDVTIDTMNVYGENNAIFGLTSGDPEQLCDNLNIGNLNIDSFVKTIALMAADRGITNSIYIGNINALIRYRVSWAASRFSFFNAGSARRLFIGDTSIRIVDVENSFVSGNIFAIACNNIAVPSFIGKINFSVDSAVDTFIRITNCTRYDLLAITNGVKPSNQTYVQIQAGDKTDRLMTFGDVINGTWKAGDILYNNFAGSDQTTFAYVCTAGGTPGTWKTIALP